MKGLLGRRKEENVKDDEIVELFWKRDEDALSESQKVYGNYCMHIARNILFNEQDSEECFNSVLLAAWESIPPQKPQNLKTYLGRLARIISFDCIRKKNMKKRIPEDAVTSIDELRFILTSPIAAIYRGNIPFMVIFPCEIAPCILPEKDIFQIVVVKISVAGSNGGVAIVRGNGRHSQSCRRAAIRCPTHW